MITVKKPSDFKKENEGSFILIYGPPWVGKTESTLRSAKKIIEMNGSGTVLFVSCEPRGDNRKVVKKIGFTDDEIHIIEYTDEHTADEVIEFLSSPEECQKYFFIFFDGLTYTMQFTLQDEVTGQAHSSRDKDQVGKKVLASMTKMTKESHGVVNGLVKRMLKALQNRSKDKIVVVSALEDTLAQWGDRYMGGPTLTGKEVPKSIESLFGYIGRVSSRYEFNEDGTPIMENNRHKKAYPPLIEFEGGEDFLAKGGGAGPLDFSKILRLDKKGGK